MQWRGHSDATNYVPYKPNVPFHFVYQIGEKYVETYVNGKLQVKVQYDTSLFKAPTKFCIATGCNNPFSGLISDFRVYKGALSSE